LVSVAVTISFGDVGTSAVVDGARSIANAAGIEVSDAVVHVVTDAILVCVSSTVTAAHVYGVQLVSVAVTVSCGDLCASTVIDGAGPVADAAGVNVSDAVVHVVTDAILVCVSSTVTTADIQGVQLVSITVAVSGWNVGTTTLIDGARSLTNATGIGGSHAVVHVVTDAVLVCVSSTVTTTHVKGVQLVSITVTISSRDVGASAVIDGARSVANSASVHRSNTRVHVIADSVLVCVGGAVSAAHANDVIEQTFSGGGVREVAGAQV
jgi:hypothetical protein